MNEILNKRNVRQVQLQRMNLKELNKLSDDYYLSPIHESRHKFMRIATILRKEFPETFNEPVCWINE